MLILGVIMIVVGCICSAVGLVMKMSFASGLGSLFGELTGGYYQYNDGSSLWLIIGAVLVVLGIVFLILGAKKKPSAAPAGYVPYQVPTAPTVPAAQAAPVAAARFCPNCGTPAAGGKFCAKCGTPL